MTMIKMLSQNWCGTWEHNYEDIDGNLDIDANLTRGSCEGLTRSEHGRCATGQDGPTKIFDHHLNVLLSL